ncbi:Uncharacterised protein [Mesomycoplasma conjunctivae]|uniref:hypothetical protein n=1 Tax=Mesomycoplasma conjunctivae TaxID=45361 RepID=UPI0002FD7414|nr:hypothetical protein [Mesomycoplasma conjunctivae]VEU66523.1 Uncharacterised protein [Mesomycoplasma conjunctivae]
MNVDSIKYLNKKIDIDVQKIWNDQKVQLVVKELKVSFQEFEENIFLFLLLIKNNSETEIKIIRNSDGNLIRKISMLKKISKSYDHNLFYTEVSFQEYYKIIDFSKTIEKKYPDLMQKFAYYKTKLKNIMEKNRWIFWYGNTNQEARTYLLKLLAVLFAKNSNKTVAYFNIDEFALWFTNTNKKEQYYLPNVLKNVDVLIFESINQNIMNSWVLTIINPILQSRLISEKITLFGSPELIEELTNAINYKIDLANRQQAKIFVELIISNSKTINF